MISFPASQSRALPQSQALDALDDMHGIPADQSAVSDPCDLLMLLGPDMASAFKRLPGRLHADSGRSVSLIETGSGFDGEARDALHRSGMLGQQTEVTMCFHGAMIDGVHHVQVNGALRPTLEFLDSFRTGPDGEVWRGRVVLHSCFVVRLAEQVRPGMPAWEKRECLLIGSNDAIPSLDGILVLEDVLHCLLERRGWDDPTLHEALARSASLSGGAVAAFGGALLQPVVISGREGLDLLNDAYRAGEARRQSLQEAMDAKNEEARAEAATGPMDAALLKQAMQRIAGEDPGQERLGAKQAARVCRMLLRGRAEKASALISAYPQVLLGDAFPGMPFSMMLASFDLPAGWIAQQWAKARSFLVASCEQHCASRDAAMLALRLEQAARAQIVFADEEIRKLMQACPAGDKQLRDMVFQLACSSPASLKQIRAALGDAAFQELARRQLFIACDGKQAGVVDLLLHEGAADDVVDDDGHSLWHAAICCRAHEVIPILLEWAVPLDRQDRDGKTPLHLACLDRNLDLVWELLMHGASTEIRDQKGWTPLHHAAFTGCIPVVELLLKHGADKHARDSMDGTPATYGEMHYARQPQLRKLLGTA